MLLRDEDFGGGVAQGELVITYRKASWATPFSPQMVLGRRGNEQLQSEDIDSQHPPNEK
jgi:hypothetical protein